MVRDESEVHTLEFTELDKGFAEIWTLDNRGVFQQPVDNLQRAHRIANVVHVMVASEYNVAALGND